MPKTTNRDKADLIKSQLLEELTRAVSNAEESLGPSLGQIIQDFVVAMEYRDEVLALSSSHAAFAVMRDLLQEYIEKQIGITGREAKGCQHLKELRGEVWGEIDEPEKTVLRGFDPKLREWADARNSAS